MLFNTGKIMRHGKPRGIAVVDVGYTNTKIALFASDGAMVAERKAASRHVQGLPYFQIDPEPMVALCRSALPELDRILPIDAIVPCAHGAAMACVAADGSLALPVMNYTLQPPAGIVADYKTIMPGYEEAFCPLLPLAITHGLQLYWQQRMWPDDFARIAILMPWIQYVGFRLSGTPVTEISSMACQTHLLDIRTLRILVLESIQQEVPVAEDDRQDVVEVMRDAAGELTDRFHLLRLPQL